MNCLTILKCINVRLIYLIFVLFPWFWQRFIYKCQIIWVLEKWRSHFHQKCCIIVLWQLIDERKETIEVVRSKEIFKDSIFLESKSCSILKKFSTSCWFTKTVLLFLSVGQTILLGAHDVTNCQESKGCMEVQISEVRGHEMAMIGGVFHNDIAVVK